MENNTSFYDAFTGHEAPPQPELEYKHANRQDLHKPYESEFSNKCEDAPTGAEKTTSAATEYWRFFTGQQTKCPIAMGINGSFDRNTSDFKGDKARYIQLYSERLNA